MKKLKLNSTLNHKSDDYETYDISIEKVITLYGRSFSELKSHPLRDSPYITENRDLMYMDSDNVTDYLLLLKINDEWKCVAKAYNQNSYTIKK